MGIITSESGKLVKIGGIGMLIVMSLISTIQVNSNHRNQSSSISCEGDGAETMLVVPDRQRTRVLLDILNKLMFLPSPVQQARLLFGEMKSVELKSLFVNAYQRNVFYVFAFSTVP
jgi:hypothetical protein